MLVLYFFGPTIVSCDGGVSSTTIAASEPRRLLYFFLYLGGCSGSGATTSSTVGAGGGGGGASSLTVGGGRGGASSLTVGGGRGGGATVYPSGAVAVVNYCGGGSGGGPSFGGGSGISILTSIYLTLLSLLLLFTLANAYLMQQVKDGEEQYHSKHYQWQHIYVELLQYIHTRIKLSGYSY